jgi:hypothetical protein
MVDPAPSPSWPTACPSPGRAWPSTYACCRRPGCSRPSAFGRETRFCAGPEALGVARDYLDRVAARWDDALLRLKAHVEST